MGDGPSGPGENRRVVAQSAHSGEGKVYAQVGWYEEGEVRDCRTMEFYHLVFWCVAVPLFVLALAGFVLWALA